MTGRWGKRDMYRPRIDETNPLLELRQAARCPILSPPILGRTRRPINRFGPVVALFIRHSSDD